MSMQKGICMELKEDRSVFLLKSGQFVKGKPAGSTAVGEESYFYPIAEKSSKKVWTPIWVPIIAAIAVLALFLSVAFPAQEAFAYVQVEINPGLEMGVNEKGNVISIRPLNGDGTLLIERLGDWKNQPLNSILTEIFNESIANDTEDITITTVAAKKKGKNRTSIDKMVLAVSSEIANERISIRLKEASREDWRRSVKEHVPVGNLVEKSTPVKIEQKQDPIPAPKPETPAVKTDEPVSDEKTTESAPENKTQAPAKEKADKPAPHNNKNTVPGQDKKQQTPAKEEKEKSESTNKNTIPGQDKKLKTEPAKEKPSNSGEGNKEKEHPSSNKEKVPSQEKKPDKENGNGDSSSGKGAPGPNDNGRSKSDSPGQQKKNKDGKE